MSRPFVSICIPTYNGSAYIRPCVESVLSQTFKDFEVIVSDDGSTDDTLEIIAEYARKDERIKVSHNDTGSKNFNSCLASASGEWVKFVFHDDLIYPDCLEKMVKNIDPSVPINCCLRDFRVEEGVDAYLKEFFSSKITTLDKLFPDISSPRRIEGKVLSALAIEKLGKNFFGEATNMLLHRSISARFGYQNRDFSALGDLELWMRIASNTGLVYIPEKLACFRVHKKSKTAKLVEKPAISHKFDIILLLYHYAFDPAYVSLRDALRDSDKPLDLATLLAWKVRDIYKSCKTGNKDQNEDYLKAMIRKYPAIAQFSKRIVIHSKKWGTFPKVPLRGSLR